MEKFFISRPIFAISLAIALVLLGLSSIVRLPVEQYPDITPPVIEVSASYVGADAEKAKGYIRTAFMDILPYEGDTKVKQLMDGEPVGEREEEP